MNEVTLIEMGQYLKEFEIPDIPEDTNFWLSVLCRVISMKNLLMKDM